MLSEGKGLSGAVTETPARDRRYKDTYIDCKLSNTSKGYSANAGMPRLHHCSELLSIISERRGFWPEARTLY